MAGHPAFLPNARLAPDRTGSSRIPARGSPAGRGGGSGMRLFIGVPLPPNARATTTRVLGDLKARDWPVRWVRDEGLHITLKFFGEVTTDRVDAIGEMLTFAAKDLRPMAMAMRGIGVFPAWERPRIIHLDL